MKKNITETIQVESNAIHSAEYQHDVCILKLKFSSGKMYAYSDVAYHVFEGLRSSESKGKFINQYVLRNHEFKKLQYMTEKDLNKIANIIAEKVINSLIYYSIHRSRCFRSTAKISN